MPIACKYCIATKGLKGSDVDKLPKTEEELFQHIERDHHIPVKRENETKEETLARFQRENPEAGGPNCRCLFCNHPELREAYGAA